MGLKKCTFGGCPQTVMVEDNDRNPPRCPRHAKKFTPKKIYHDHHYHRARYFYGTSQWKNLREQYINAHPLCERCEDQGYIVEGREVDHIVEIEDGGDKTDPDNLQTLCVSCHRKKTAEEKRKREEKKNMNGFNSLSDF